MAAKLTPLAVENAKPKRRGYEPVRTEIGDRGCPGLYLVVQPSRVKSWALRYRIDGRSRKLTLGGADTLTLAAARAAAAQALHQVELGNDPAAAKRAARMKPAVPADSIEAAIEQFLELYVRRKLRPASLRATESIFRRLVLPTWRGRTIHDIKRRDIIALVEAVAVDRPIQANRALAALSKFFRWLVSRDVIAASPCAGVERPGVEVARDRVLDDAEVAALWKACSDPDVGLAGLCVRMLLLTGCRRSEVAEMRWDEIDTDRRVWTLPAARSKNKKAHAVPLVPCAWEIISAQPRISNFVFTVTGDGPICNFDRPKRRLDGKLPFAKPWRVHDIRRSVASGLQRLGVRVEVIESALNHTSGVFRGIVGTYQRHNFLDEKRIALQGWADHIERLAGGTAAKVGPLRSGGR
jgi:integrase